MKNLNLCALFIAAFLFSGVFLIAQNPITLIWEGTLTDINGAFVANEECLVSLSIETSDEEVLFKNESAVTTNETGEFLYLAETLPPVFSDNWEKELVDIEISIKAAEGASWLEEDEFVIKYHFEKNKIDSFTMTRFEGQVLNYSKLNPIWQFTDLYPFGYLNSTFMISLNKEFADPESIMTICKMMQNEIEKIPPTKAEPAPAKRGIKGGYAVGGVKK